LSIPTAFVYAAIGAIWAERPLVVLLVGWVLPIPTLPVGPYVLRGTNPEQR
jgi:hypothetical protein